MIFKNIKYNALLLLIIFTIPVIYQSGHVLVHHSNDVFYCCTDNENETGFYVNDSEQNQHCVIAEYTFTHKDLPEGKPYTFTNNFDPEILNFYTHSGYKNLKTDTKSSRGPPQF